MSVKFSVIVVCLNAGSKLKETIDSVLKQTYENYEIVVKDGFSKDGSIEELKERIEREQLTKIKLYQEKDSGIYDAMNQACCKMQGDYCIFMNCGDFFYSGEVLERFARAIGEQRGNHIFYGNRYNALSGSVEYSAGKIDAFTCYRNIPCHQTCFYSVDLFKKRNYNLQYKVRADYEHFLWCYFVGKAAFSYVEECVVSYEGGGFSETEENVKRSAREHKEITSKYMKKGQLFLFRMYLIVTLSGIRHRLATSKSFAGVYNRMIKVIYRR